MSKITFHGKLQHRIRSYWALSRLSITVLLRRLCNRSLVSKWPFLFEIGVLFWRHQFNVALAAKDIKVGRDYFDSVITATGETFPVSVVALDEGRISGHWYSYQGEEQDNTLTMLYLHGGGYAFRSKVSYNFAKSLAGLLQMDLFMPHYRLTPENSHPAQIEDALSAYRTMLDKGIDPSRLVLLGDSAGGHLALMLLQALRNKSLSLPALTIGLCPWTDIGDRGTSLFANDKYDLVQGYMAIEFGKWLQGDQGDKDNPANDIRFSREQLSPIYHDYKDLGPLYLQAGGREILVDMIRAFAVEVQSQGAEVMLDVWPEMTHNFQMHGQTHPDSLEAFERLKEIIKTKVETDLSWSPCKRTEVG